MNILEKYNVGKDDAIIIIDVQNDFIDGSLRVVNGPSITTEINKIVEQFRRAGATIVATQDWHPATHSSFASMNDTVPFTVLKMSDGTEQVMWPDHCVQGTDGAEFHPNIKQAIRSAHMIVRKGYNIKVDSYSAFRENDKVTVTGLAGFLKDRGVKRCFFVGLAYDVCVKSSAIDAIDFGFESVIVKSMTRSVASIHDLNTVEHEMAEHGVIIEGDFF